MPQIVSFVIENYDEIVEFKLKGQRVLVCTDYAIANTIMKNQVGRSPVDLVLKKV
jgi:hypothetical protein